MHFLPAPRRDNWARFCWHEGALSGVECDTIIALGQSRQKERATVDIGVGLTSPQPEG